MRWQKPGFAEAADFLETHFKSCGWTLWVAPDARWQVPSWILEEADRHRWIAFDDGSVVVIMSSYDPNSGCLELPLFWIGTPN